MKRIIYIPLGLLIATPSFASDQLSGDVSIGARTTHYYNDNGDKSAKYEEYLDMSNGVFGDVNLLFDTEEYYLGLSVVNPNLDDRSYEAWGGRFGLGKIRFYYDELRHNYSFKALTPLGGTGSNHLTIPTPVPPVSEWDKFDYEAKKKKYGVDVTLDQEKSPFYYKFSMEEQKSNGTMPWGVTLFSGFEVPIPVDYTTDNYLFESGYRNKETTAVLTAGYSKFNDQNDILTVTDGAAVEEYSVPTDNYSYSFGGRLVQRLPMDNLLALKASYNRNKSDPDFSQFTNVSSPTADSEYDGDVQYIRAGAVLNTQWSALLDTRLYYNYIDRNNKSEQITTDDTGDERTNHLFEYDKNEAGIDANYRLNKTNKLSGGYDFSYTNRNRDDAQNTMDNTVFAELKNTSLDWMTTKLRLEYLNRDSDSGYSTASLTGDGEIQEYFTPVDYASKDRYKAKLAFDISPTEDLGVSLSYALIYDDYDATELGVQDAQRQEIYLDFNSQLPAKIRLNAYFGYEYTKTNYDARRYSDNANPNDPTTTANYNWSQKTTYDFFVVGGSLAVPVIERLELVFNADYQKSNGSIDFNRPDAAGASLENINDADDYYKTQLGVKGIYQATDSWTVTLGYLYEKFHLNEWGYNNYEYDNGYYLSGAGLDSDYETSQVYVITTFHF